MQAKNKPYLDSETYVAGDDCVDSETITADLEAALSAARERRQDRSLPLRTTLLADDGRQIVPALMTTAEANAHLADLQAGGEPALSDAPLSYDAENDALLTRVPPTDTAAGAGSEREVVLHYDAGNNLIGVEVRHASRRLPRLKIPAGSSEAT